MRWWPFRKSRKALSWSEFASIDPPQPLINLKVHEYVGEPPEPRVWITCTRPSGWHFGSYGPAEYDMEVAVEVGRCA